MRWVSISLLTDEIERLCCLPKVTQQISDPAGIWISVWPVGLKLLLQSLLMVKSRWKWNALILITSWFAKIISTELTSAGVPASSLEKAEELVFKDWVSWGRGKPCLVAFASFCGIHTSIMVNFGLKSLNTKLGRNAHHGLSWVCGSLLQHNTGWKNQNWASPCFEQTTISRPRWPIGIVLKSLAQTRDPLRGSQRLLQRGLHWPFWTFLQFSVLHPHRESSWRLSLSLSLLPPLALAFILTLSHLSNTVPRIPFPGLSPPESCSLLASSYSCFLSQLMSHFLRELNPWLWFVFSPQHVSFGSTNHHFIEIIFVPLIFLCLDISSQPRT